MGKIYVVGIGPGGNDQMTIRAARVLEECQVIVGYTVYIDLVKEKYLEKRLIATPMKQEVKRCRMAFEEAKEGVSVAVVCSGDAGIYGMAGLIYELSVDYPGIEIEVVPGITAASGGAAVLGAPLMHDFAVISLSDLLTPWEKIEKRLRMAAMADFVICIYNPSSRKRADYLKKACECMLEFKEADTVCGIVKNIGREGEFMQVMSLKKLSETDVDMFTTVFIGNEQTKRIGDKMVTPRGYKDV
ncbi:MAG: precorrin-3B C(17)-methyltransferase [Bariatricus sp.]|nr:precorrin-3B C(17)-methyltransferase [Bariatricus sp.]